MRYFFFVVISLVGALIAYCFYAFFFTPEVNENIKADIQSEILEVAIPAVDALKNKNTQVFSQYIHPQKGLRFSPYAFVDISTDKWVHADDLHNLFLDTMMYNWGIYDGSGEEIHLSFLEYYEKFIYDEDFLNAPEIYFDERKGRGNTLDNTQMIYPDAHIVEFHFPKPEAYQGLGWKSLRLVFESYQGKWYISGIIHDQWTI